MAQTRHCPGFDQIAAQDRKMKGRSESQQISNKDNT